MRFQFRETALSILQREFQDSKEYAKSKLTYDSQR
jgi:hypothetical protein